MINKLVEELMGMTMTNSGWRVTHVAKSECRRAGGLRYNGEGLGDYGQMGVVVALVCHHQGWWHTKAMKTCR